MLIGYNDLRKNWLLNTLFSVNYESMMIGRILPHHAIYIDNNDQNKHNNYVQ